MGGRIMASTINADTSNGVIITPDTSGEIELQANGVTKAKVTANGLQDANGNSLRGGMYRNLIINGDMQIAQRGTSVTGVNGNNIHTVDRWYNIQVNSGVYTHTQDSDVPTGQGFAKSWKIQCTTASSSPASGDLLRVQQTIEAQNLQHLAYGTSSAKTMTFSFWVKSNKTGTYGIWVYQPDSVRHIGISYTINTANTWEQKTVTIEGDTSGTINNDNGAGLTIAWYLSAGSDFTSGTHATSWESVVNANRLPSGQVNFADSTSNYINITGVQLEVGEGASDFEFLPYDVQLQRCQRYYELINDSNYSSYGVMAGGTSQFFAGYVDYKQIKRATPTITITGSFLIQGNSNQPGTTSMGTSGIGKRAVYINGTGIGSNVVNGYAYNLLDVNGYIKVDAEL